MNVSAECPDCRVPLRAPYASCPCGWKKAIAPKDMSANLFVAVTEARRFKLKPRGEHETEVDFIRRVNIEGAEALRVEFLSKEQNLERLNRERIEGMRTKRLNRIREPGDDDEEATHG